MGYEVLTSKGEKIILEDKPIAKGGEGEVRKIISPAHYKKNCVKIYKEKYRTEEREKRIRFMINNAPNPLPAKAQTTLLIGWPIETIYDLNNNFIGFMMPIAFPDSVKLNHLTGTTSLKNDWLKFARENRFMVNRYKLMQNIAIFMYSLHHTKKYVLVDFKPDNVLVSHSGQVTIIDTDSIQITDGQQLLFEATATTAKYTPPENYKVVEKTKEQTWDYFSLSVVFYELLLGVHPYNGIIPKFQSNGKITDNIRDDVFPFGNNAHKIKFPDPPSPNPHKEFKKLPQNVQDMFIRSFSLNIKQRTSVREWIDIISIIIDPTSQIKPPPSLPPLPVYLTAYPTTLTFAAIGSSETVTVTTDGSSFEVKKVPKWCSVVNKTTSSFQIECKPNNTNMKRIEKILIESAPLKVEVAIEQEPVILEVIPQILEFEAKGSTKTVNVTTNCSSFTVTNLPAWCSVINQTAYSFQIVCSPNTGEKRDDSITVASGQITKRIEVKQEKAKRINWLLIAIIALIITGLGAYILFKPTPDDSIASDNATVTKPISTEITTNTVPVDNITSIRTSPTVQENVVQPPPTSTATTSERTTSQTSTICEKCTINYSFGRYEGRTVNSIPDGKGTIYYHNRTLIDERDAQRRYAEAGQYITGDFNNGRLVQGRLYDSNNNQLDLIIIGRAN